MPFASLPFTSMRGGRRCVEEDVVLCETQPLKETFEQLANLGVSLCVSTPLPSSASA